MNTDWKLIKNLLNTTIDALESAESCGDLREKSPELINVNGTQVSVFDFLQSAWTYPENLKYEIIRDRHDLNDDKAYTPELARALVEAAKLASELIGASEVNQKPNGASSESIEEKINKLSKWYSEHFAAKLKAVAAR